MEDERERKCVRCWNTKPQRQFGPLIGRDHGVCDDCITPLDHDGPVVECSNRDIMAAALDRADTNPKGA